MTDAKDQPPVPKPERPRPPLLARLLVVWGVGAAAALAYANHSGTRFLDVFGGPTVTHGATAPRHGGGFGGPGTFIHFHK